MTFQYLDNHGLRGRPLMIIGAENISEIFFFLMVGGLSKFSFLGKALLIFEPTCANARWALMRRFPSVRLSVCLSVAIPKVTR